MKVVGSLEAMVVESTIAPNAPLATVATTATAATATVVTPATAAAGVRADSEPETVVVSIDQETPHEDGMGAVGSG